MPRCASRREGEAIILIGAPRAGSASPSTCARFSAARTGRRRRSTLPPRSATATSCASSSARARSTACHDCLRRRPRDRARRDGDGRRHRRGDRPRVPGTLPLHAFLVRRGSGALRDRRRADHATGVLCEAEALRGVARWCSAPTGGDLLILPDEACHIGRKAEGGARGLAAGNSWPARPREERRRMPWR